MAQGTQTTWSERMRSLEVLLHLPSLVRLHWRLLHEPRVSVWPKALLLGAVGYVILPFDLIPDAIPLLGQVDDVVILVVAARWFVGWCPPEVVQEHARAIGARRVG
jgi:uncharacterized membrane protein YkvA (DUF1232 family)